MPKRRFRIIPGVPHHVTQRASHGQFILNSDDAKAVLIHELCKWSERTGVIVFGFVIMENHFHLAATAPDSGALGKMMGCATAEFSRWRNASVNDHGPNWQDRYFACPMDPEHSLMALRYIERNPVAAGLVRRAWEWRWSSAAHHCGLAGKPALIGGDLRSESIAPREWRQLLDEAVPERVRAMIKQRLNTGHALAADAWILEMEERWQVQLRPRRPGRPPKTPSA